MTITIDLPQQTLEALQVKAEAQGRLTEQVAAEYLIAGIEDEDEETAINTSLDELESGQGRPFTEFADELSKRFSVRYETR